MGSRVSSLYLAKRVPAARMRDADACERLRHAHGAETDWQQGRRDDHDLHIRHGETGVGYV